MKKMLLLSVVLLLSGTILFAAQPAMLFLSSPIGAAGAGLGGAYTARADGVQAMYWNPAGLYMAENDNEVMFFHNSYIEDLKHIYLGYTRNIPELYGTLGVSLNLFDHGDFDGYILGNTPGSATPTGKFDSKDMAFGISYNPETKHPVKFGVSMNFIKGNIDDADATGFAFDFGWRYDDDMMDIPYRAALAVKNIGGKIQYDKQKEQLPLMFKTGFTLDYRLNEEFILSPVIDIVRDQQVKETYLMTGVEVCFDDMFTFRIGYDGMKDIGNNIAFGCGIKYREFGFNYAWKDFGDLSSAHLIEMLYKF